MAVNRKPRPRTRTEVVAGAFCIVEGDRIVRATAPNGRDFWQAGRGSWSRKQVRESKAWPLHYAGFGHAAPALA